MTITTINEVNEDCLILVLRRFSIQELIGHRLVCKWWLAVINGMFRAKQSMKLFGSKDDVFFYCSELPKYHLDGVDDFVLRPAGQRDDDIVCKNGLVMRAITYLFPNLRRLLICNYENAWQEELPTTLDWLPNLEALTLFGLYNSTLPRQFWSSIKRLYNLKELHLLDMDTCKIPSNFLPKFNDLNQFTLIDYQFHVGAFIQELGRSTRVLRLDNVELVVDHFRLCLQANPLLANNLTHLTIGTLNNQRDQKTSYKELLRVIGQHLKKLASLDILLYRDIRLIDVATELSNLPVLTDLWLNIGWADKSTHMENALMSPALVSVKRLYLTDFTHLNVDNFYQIFPRIFPNLEYLQLDSLNDRFLVQVETDYNLGNLFPRLRQFKPIYHKVEYNYAGRHEQHFREYMAERLPVMEHEPENVRDEIYDVLYYSEGEGDDDEMFAAVFDD